MIGKLRGYVDIIRADHLILDVGGVGYRIFASTITLEQLRSDKEQVSLFIETHVREDHIHLYGFLAHSDQELFNLLTTVQGVGNKMAICVQGVFNADAIINIIIAQDIAALTRVNGIGKRIAERIVIELKNKLPALSLMNSVAAAPTDRQAIEVPLLPVAVASTIVTDAISALENLGYSRTDAHRACLLAAQQGSSTLNELIPAALKLLS